MCITVLHTYIYIACISFSRIIYTNKTKNRLSKFGLHFFPFVYCVTRIIIYDAPTLVHLPMSTRVCTARAGFIFCLLPTVQNAMISCGVLSPRELLLCIFFFYYIDVQRARKKRVKQKGEEVEREEKHTREFMSLK